MLWVYIIVISIWLGYEFIRYFVPINTCPKIDQFNILSGAIPLGFTFVTWLFYFVRLFHPLNFTIGIVTSILITFVCILFHYINDRTAKQLHFRILTNESFVIFFSLFAFFFVFTDKSMLKNGCESCGTVFSDLPFHLGLISSFAYGVNSKYNNNKIENNVMTTPFYLGSKLCYPIVPDFYSAILVGCGGASLRVSIAVPTMLLMISLVFTLHFFFLTFSSMRHVPELAMVIFIFAGGVGWKWFFIKECRENPNNNLSHCFCANKETFWIQSVAHFLFPQRSAAFSMPLCLFIMTLLILLAFLPRSKSATNNMEIGKGMFLAGVMMGLLPMISAHSYIAIGLFAIGLFIVTFPYPSNIWQLSDIKDNLWDVFTFWAPFGFTSILISLPQIAWLLSGNRHNFFTLEPIWFETEEKKSVIGYFTMWWESLGTFHFLAIINCWKLMNKREICIYLPAMFVYVISNFLRYQPGAMDNTKVFLAVWYPLACIVVSKYIMTLINNARDHRKLMIFIVVSLFVSFSFSSLVCFCRNLSYNFPIFDGDELNMGLWVMENTRADSGILSDGWHSCPPMSIGGRAITMGYNGWVWSHGLDYDGRYAFEQELVKDRENIILFEEWKIRYAISKNDDQGYNMFPSPEEYSRWMLVCDIGAAKIYRVLNNIC